MYLWHWPLLVFSQFFFPAGSKSIFSNLYFVILITIVLSILTYRFVENPIRKKKSKKVVITLLIMMISLGIFSLVCMQLLRDRNFDYDKNYVGEFLRQA